MTDVYNMYKSKDGYYYKKTSGYTKRISADMYQKTKSHIVNPKKKSKITSREIHLEKYIKHKNKLNNQFTNNVLKIFYITLNKKKYKIAMFKTIFEIKEKHHGKGYGTKIINKILEHVDYLLVKNIMNENAKMFWQKFNHINMSNGFGKKILNIIRTKQKVIKPKYLLSRSPK